MTLFSATHTSNTEHHTSPGHVSEPELKASENSPDNGLTFRYVLSNYLPSYVGIICIYPIIYDDHM